MRGSAVTWRPAPVRELETRLAIPPSPGSFSEAELEGIPDPLAATWRQRSRPARL
jgi:hypothetical protein